MDAVADHGVITGDTVTGTADAAQAVFDKLDRGRHRPARRVQGPRGRGRREVREVVAGTARGHAGSARRRQEMSEQSPTRPPRRRTGVTRCGTSATSGCRASPGPCGVVIFGVTGDLARKKLMPAIYDLANRGLLPADVRPGRVRPTGLGRRGLRQGRPRRGQAARPHAVPPGGLGPAGRGNPVRAGHLRRRRRVRAAGRDTARSSTPSAAPAAITRSTCRSRRRRSRRCASSCRSPGWPGQQEGRWSRVVIEKPFGHDLKSARELNGVVNSVFPEESVFRIDHYLGKETVQNILALRFANELFEPIWNANYVDHVQITMAEDIGLGGRGGYYDGIGAARDVIQNHLLQLLALTAMEEPVSFSPHGTAGREDQGALGHPARCEPLDQTTARGQYAAGWQGGEKVRRPARGGGVLQGLHHRDVRGDHAGDRHPPLGRRAVLPAHRKTAGPQGDRDRTGLQAGAAPAVRHDDDRGTRQERVGDPGAARRGHHHCGSAPRCPAARWRSATSTWTSPTARRSPRTPPRRTSG